MKQFIKIFLLGIVAAISLSSCDDPLYPNGNGDGKDQGSLKTSTLSVNVLNAAQVIESRSGVDVSGFTVKILKKEDNTVVNTWKYGEMPEIVTLNVGDYILEVYNAEVQDAAWDAPYYYASKEFSIVKNDVTDLGTVTCKLQNVKVTIQYSDVLKAAIGDGKDVKVNVVMGETGTLDFVYGETRSGFFKFIENSPSLVATFSGTVEGYYVSDFKVISDVAAGQHRIITFSLKDGPTPPDEYGSIGTTGLSLDFKVKTVNLAVNIPMDEDEVEPDDMLKLDSDKLTFTAAGGSKTVNVTSTSDWSAVSSQSWCKLSLASGAKGETSVSISADEYDGTESSRSAIVTFTMGSITRELLISQAPKADQSAPVITSETINLNGVNNVSDYGTGSLAQVLITASNGIAHLNVKIESDNEGLAAAIDDMVGLEFDLAYPPSDEEKVANIKGLGFPTGNDVIGKTELTFDISQFVPLLAGFPGNHKFILNVVDANGGSVDATLNFLAQ